MHYFEFMTGSLKQFFFFGGGGGLVVGGECYFKGSYSLMPLVFDLHCWVERFRFWVNHACL